MSGYKYSTEIKENMSKAVGISLPISSKTSREICNKIKGMKVSSAKDFLSRVVLLKEPVPYKRYNSNVPHKTVIGPGRFPSRASVSILEILKSAEANAQFKGLSINNLFVKHISAQRAGKTMRYGRNRYRAKRTNIEIVLEEKK
jgi:large subunit ribosomal protein L22